MKRVNWKFRKIYISTVYNLLRDSRLLEFFRLDFAYVTLLNTESYVWNNKQYAESMLQVIVSWVCDQKRCLILEPVTLWCLVFMAVNKIAYNFTQKRVTTVARM